MTIGFAQNNDFFLLTILKKSKNGYFERFSISEITKKTNHHCLGNFTRSKCSIIMKKFGVSEREIFRKMRGR